MIVLSVQHRKPKPDPIRYGITDDKPCCVSEWRVEVEYRESAAINEEFAFGDPLQCESRAIGGDRPIMMDFFDPTSSLPLLSGLLLRTEGNPRSKGSPKFLNNDLTHRSQNCRPPFSKDQERNENPRANDRNEDGASRSLMTPVECPALNQGA